MRRLLGLIAILASAQIAPPTDAQTVIAPGTLLLDGYPVSCGASPTILTGPELGDLAKGGPGGIFLNWPSFSSYPTGVKIFIYAHECSHFLFGSDENLADRFAINLGRNQGWINDLVLQQICQSVIMSPGSWTHLPGPPRCRNMINYFQNG